MGQSGSRLKTPSLVGTQEGCPEGMIGLSGVQVMFGASLTLGGGLTLGPQKLGTPLVCPPCRGGELDGTKPEGSRSPVS